MQRALKLQPHDYYANLLVGIDLLRTERAKEAVPYLREASRAKPADDIPLDYLTEAQARLHRYADAAEASSRAVDVAPSSEQAVQGAIGFALERFRTLSGELRSTVAGLAAEQRLQAMSHALTDQERLLLLQSSSAGDPDAPGIWTDLAETNAAQGHQEEARADLLKVHGWGDDAPGARTSSAAGLAASAGMDGQAWFRRGAALVSERKWSAAAIALEHSLQAGVDTTYARYLLCLSYAQRTGETVRLLQSQSGDQATVHLVRGDVMLRMQNNGKAAIGEYTAALGSSGNDPALLERLAEAQLQDGQMDAAVQSAKAALRVDSHRFAAMHTLAKVAMEQRRYSEAMPYLQRLYAQDPADAGVQVQLGTALARTGDAAGAVQLLSAPLQHGYPDQKGNLHALLGTALRKTGQEQQASEAFAAARSLSGEYQKSSHPPSGEHEP